MTLRAQVIHKIISEIDSLPEAKLKRILEILESDGNLTEKKKTMLDFAGISSDLDLRTFKELTTDLKKRSKYKRTIN